MDARTLTALEGSIKKWEEIVAGEGDDQGPNNCPLCHLFQAEADPDDPEGLQECFGCPVSKKVSTDGCRETPYTAWNDKTSWTAADRKDRMATTPELVALAQAELDFLKSLRPTGQVLVKLDPPMTFEKIIQVQPPFDKRHSDPKQNYGIGGMTLRFILKGPKGATQFIFYTGQHLKHVADELYTSNRDVRFNPFHGMGADIGRHAYAPGEYDDKDKPSQKECDILGCPCWYDGSGLQASEFEDEFLRDGEPAVWRMLEERYYLWLDQKEAAA